MQNRSIVRQNLLIVVEQKTVNTCLSFDKRRHVAVRALCSSLQPFSSSKQDSSELTWQLMDLSSTCVA